MFTFTDMAIDYSVDELDDLTSRKVAPEGIDGDRLARIVRRRRGTARATGERNPYPGVNVAASVNLWGSSAGGRTLRMAAVGISDRSALAWTDGTDVELGIPAWELVTY